MLTEWERTVTTYRVLGKNAHDARLVAAMVKILTFNTADFVRFRETQALDPHLVL